MKNPRTIILHFRSYQSIRFQSTHSKTLDINGTRYETNPKYTNITPTILSHINRKLHLQLNHPINILRRLIEDKINHDKTFKIFNHFPSVVSVFENFDSLGFPLDHSGRSKSDTYYINDQFLLRTHTSAHEMAFFEQINEIGRASCRDRV